MKTKEKQGYTYLPRLAATFLILSFALLIGILPVGAAQIGETNNFLDENYNMTEEYSALLSAESNLYSSLDTTPGKTVSKSVLSLINAYRKELLDLQSHADADKRLLTKEIKLAYSKGCAAGRLGWIYHYNYPRLSTEGSRELLRGEYENYLAEIDGATDHAVLTARADVIAAEMNATVYSQLINELAAPTDSLASASVIASGLAKIAEIEDKELFAPTLSEVLKETEHALTLQRSRDLLAKQMQDIFSIILPNADHSSDGTVALFTYKLKNAQDIQTMNSALQSALQALLAVSEADIYSFLYRSQLCESIAEATLKASGEERVVDLLPLFADFATLSTKAVTKDEIRAILLGNDASSDPQLLKIEKQFNGDGGLVDLAPKELLALEKARAESARSCFDAYSKTLLELDVVLLPYGYSAFSERAEVCFESFSQKLYALSGYAGFEDGCTSLLSEAEREFGFIICEAKAERFLLDHKAILQKSAESLNESDETALRHALCDYVSLEASVQAALVSQINSIAEKYNAVLSKIIRSKLSDDALYLDLCENICNELSALPRENIAEYYNNCDQVLKKSARLFEIVSAYRAVCSGELYDSFNSSEREELVVICRESASTLVGVDVNDKAMFDSELDDILEDAKVKMGRTNEIVRIRVATRSSENSQIKALAADANAKIKASYDISEMVAIADKTIFKINRLLCVDAIELYSEKEKFAIENMEFLTSDEKNAFIASLNSTQTSLSDDAKLAENVTVLGFIWSTFEEKLAEIHLAADSENLKRSKEEHTRLFENEVEKLTDELRAMVYLTSAKCEEYLNKINQLQASFKSKLTTLQSSDEVNALYQENLEILSSINISASGENLGSYKNILLSELDSYMDLKSNYSDENYNKILDILTGARDLVAASGSIGSCNEVLESTKKKIDAVNDLLDDAKEDAVSKLEALASTYSSQSELYSSAALSAIEQILSEGKRRINAFSEISDLAALKTELEERLTSLRSVKKDYLTTCPSGLSFTANGTEYPLQHDFSTGYWGLLYSKDGLDADALLSLEQLTNYDASSIEKLIRRAAKEQTLKYFGTSLDDVKKQFIEKGTVALSFDITLEGADFPDSPVTLQMLLPSTLKDENILGVAFVAEDGSVEFYGVEQRDLLVSLPLEHFSSYYVVVESTTDLLPLIIILSIIIILELIVFALLIFVRFNRVRKENGNMLPILSACFISPFTTVSAARVTPSGAVGATILLSVAALALGCGIALLVRAELRDSTTKKARAQHQQRKRHTQAPEEQEIPLIKGAEKPLLKARVYTLDAPKKRAESADENYYTESADEEARVLCGVGAAQSDEISEVAPPLSVANDDSRSSKHRRHKCEINLDVIESYFGEGDLVTLDSLKRLNLAPQKADHLKILARGALSKPLIVEAHDFSHAAEEMLKAVGGEAIRIRH